MVPRFQLNININNQRQGKTVLSFLPVLAVLSVTWRGGGAEAVPSMRPASPLQPRTSSSLAQPWSAASHPRTNTCTAPWYHLITCEVINDNHILTTYSVSVLR